MEFETSSDCQHCPISENTRLALEHGAGMIRAIRDLRSSMRTCAVCTDYGVCPFLNQFNAAVREAVQAVSDYWNLESFSQQHIEVREERTG